MVHVNVWHTVMLCHNFLTGKVEKYVHVYVHVYSTYVPFGTMVRTMGVVRTYTYVGITYVVRMDVHVYVYVRAVEVV
jgi:hypothetical protein